MSEPIGKRPTEEQVRRYCHEVVDRVSRLTHGRLEAAEKALREAPHDAVRQTLVEMAAGAPDPVTAAFIQAAVRTGSAQLARAAADMLLDIRDPESARQSISLCLASSDSAVRHRAVEALETLREPAALDMLAASLGSDDAGVRRSATSILGLILGSKYHPLKEMLLARLEDTQSDLHRLILEGSEVNVRREVAQALGFSASSRVLPILRALSRDPDEQTRREVVLALSAQPAEGAVDILEGMLDDPDAVVVASALDVLATRLGWDSQRLLQLVRGTLKHPLPEVRLHAVMMLDRFRPEDARQAALEAARDRDFEVRRSATALLRRLGAPLPAEAEGEPGADEESLIIWEAGNLGIEGAGSRAGASAAGEAIAVLERVALSGSRSGRIQAISELQQLRDIADSPGLQKGVNDPDDAVRSRAAASLAYTRDAALLVGLLVGHPDVLVRREALRRLAENPSGRRGTAPQRASTTFTSTRTLGMELFGPLLAGLEDADEGVRQLACEAIGRYVEFRLPMPVPEVQSSNRPRSPSRWHGS